MYPKTLINVYNMVTTAIRAVDKGEKPYVVGYYTGTGAYKISFEKIPERKEVEPKIFFYDETSEISPEVLKAFNFTTAKQEN
jgi:hypothetical protein